MCPEQEKEVKKKFYCLKCKGENVYFEFHGGGIGVGDKIDPLTEAHLDLSAGLCQDCGGTAIGIKDIDLTFTATF